MAGEFEAVVVRTLIQLFEFVGRPAILPPKCVLTLHAVQHSVAPGISVGLSSTAHTAPSNGSRVERWDMRALAKALTLLAWIVLVPSLAHAQAVIAGTVKDASGGVL